MAKGSLFVGWGDVTPGREKAAQQVIGRAMKYLHGLEQAGTIESSEAVLLEPHGGDLAGFVLIRGDKEKLAQLRVDDAFVRITLSLQMVHVKVGTIWAYSGVEMEALMRAWGETGDGIA